MLGVPTFLSGIIEGKERENTNYYLLNIERGWYLQWVIIILIKIQYYKQEIICIVYLVINYIEFDFQDDFGYSNIGMFDQ